MGVRQWLHRYVPAHFHDPVGLALRLLRSGDPAAWFAMAAAAGGIASAPIDVTLGPLERRLTQAPRAPRHPLILICGAPRSGTTVVYQTLVNHLPVAYFSNLTALFPRSPLAAHRLFHRFVRRPTFSYRSFYGRTQGLGGTNDGLYLWDRWLGDDRSAFPERLSDDRRRAMRDFFAACDAIFNGPLVNKNNSLNLSAHLVAECLPQARFICMTRNPRDLAHSLYRARRDIQGDAMIAYGVADATTSASGNGSRHEANEDPTDSVGVQVAFYDESNTRQRQRLGDRFWLISYEDFCRCPAVLVRRVARDILGDESQVFGSPPASFTPSRGDKVPIDVAARIDAALERHLCVRRRSDS
jgi:hypothetical protein